jgi:hypothetical protein
MFVLASDKRGRVKVLKCSDFYFDPLKVQYFSCLKILLFLVLDCALFRTMWAVAT